LGWGDASCACILNEKTSIAVSKMVGHGERFCLYHFLPPEWVGRNRAVTFCTPVFLILETEKIKNSPGLVSIIRIFYFYDTPTERIG
jgi:hypothetical protein